MGGFAFQVACLRLVANEPLFGVYAVRVDWPVLRQNLTMWTLTTLRFCPDGPKFILLETSLSSDGKHRANVVPYLSKGRFAHSTLEQRDLLGPNHRGIIIVI